MISTFLLSAVNSFLGFLIPRLPIGHLPTIIFDSVNYFWSALNSFTFINPVATMIQAVVVIMIYEAARFFLEFILPWVLTKIPFLHIR